MGESPGAIVRCVSVPGAAATQRHESTQSRSAWRTQREPDPAVMQFLLLQQQEKIRNVLGRRQVQGSSLIPPANIKCMGVVPVRGSARAPDLCLTRFAARIPGLNAHRNSVHHDEGCPRCCRRDRSLSGFQRSFGNPRSQTDRRNLGAVSLKCVSGRDV